MLQSLVFLGENDGTPIRAEDLPVFRTMLPPKSATPAVPDSSSNASSLGQFNDLMREKEADLMLSLLEKASQVDPLNIGSQRKAAAFLGMSRHGFVSVLRRAALIREIPAKLAHLFTAEEG